MLLASDVEFALELIDLTPQLNVPFGQIGKVTQEQMLVIRTEDDGTVIEADIAVLKEAWQKPFDW